MKSWSTKNKCWTEKLHQLLISGIFSFREGWWIWRRCCCSKRDIPIDKSVMVWLRNVVWIQFYLKFLIPQTPLVFHLFLNSMFVYLDYILYFLICLIVWSCWIKISECSAIIWLLHSIWTSTFRLELYQNLSPV